MYHHKSVAVTASGLFAVSDAILFGGRGGKAPQKFIMSEFIMSKNSRKIRDLKYLWIKM